MRALNWESRETQGFSLVELLVSLGLLVGVLLAVLAPVVSGLRAARVQPDLADLDQRLRVASTVIRAALEQTGSGLPVGTAPGPLTLRWPAVYPHRRGVDGADPFDSAFADRLTVIAAVPGGAAPPLLVPMATSSSLIGFDYGPPCDPADMRCGLRPGDFAALDGNLGSVDLLRVTAAEPGVLAHAPATLSRAYGPSELSRVLEVDIRQFRYDAARRQLRVGSGGAAEAPLLDDVLGMSVRYVGTAAPPAGPRPPMGTGNCLFHDTGVPRLVELPGAVGGLVELPLAAFIDGPFCGEGTSRYDADLFRIRRVIVSITIGWPGRWTDAAPGGRSGLERDAERREVVIDVAPRNLDVSM